MFSFGFSRATPHGRNLCPRRLPKQSNATDYSASERPRLKLTHLRQRLSSAFLMSADCDRKAKTVLGRFADPPCKGFLNLAVDGRDKPDESVRRLWREFDAHCFRSPIRPVSFRWRKRWPPHEWSCSPPAARRKSCGRP